MQIVTDLDRKIIYDPWTQVYHHRRALFLPHLRQIGRYALHRGHFARRFPATSRRISYMLPSLFLLGLITGALIAPLHHLLALTYAICIALYLFITLISAFNRRPLLWLTIWLGIIATHIVYGARFLQGLVARRMPGEVTRFDHPSETPAQ